jgi:hypothetical protein
MTAATLSGWRDVFLASGITGLKSREVDSSTRRHRHNRSGHALASLGQRKQDH